MKGHLTMSRKELDRHVVLDRVIRKDVRLSEAVPLLGVSYRQAQRLLRGYQEQGVSFLVHGLRGRVGTRCCDPAFRDAVCLPRTPPRTRRLPNFRVAAGVDRI